jgi:gliding motility-associated-like protein
MRRGICFGKSGFRIISRILAVGFLLAGFQPGFTQVANPYYLIGSATQDNCNCYTLTQDLNSVNGSVWNIYKINLRDSFDFRFNVFLGSTDANGADGIAFVLQPISTQIGTQGGGLGFAGVSPSIGVTIDTWQNTDANDPVFDHIAIQKNGDLGHGSSNNLAGPVTALANQDNIEDGKWHMLRVQWDPVSKVLKASMDGVDRVSVTVDMVADIFRNDPLVYWGFTASTGGARNLQRFCTALDPQIKSLSGVETCFGKPIQFRDSSGSFSKIVKWFWDLGDGTKDTVQHPKPHLYAAPGRYTIKLNILGNDGCLSDTLRKEIIVGSDPFAKIRWNPDPVCEGENITLIDSSAVEYGTVNQWSWTINGKAYSEKLPVIAGGFPSGNIAVSLQVRTQEGCISAPVSTTLPVLQNPSAAITGNQDVCAGSQIRLTGQAGMGSPAINRWYWQLSTGIDSSGAQLTRSFPSGGRYPVSLQVLADNGCRSAIITDTIRVFETKANAGNDTLVAIGIPFQLIASGGVFYQWTPPSGLSDPNIANPIVTLDRDMEYVLKASSPAGCSSTDTIRIKVFKGVEIYIPTAFTPNGDGLNDILRAIPIGLRFNYLKIFDRWGNQVFLTTDHRKGWDGTFKGKQMPSGTFAWMISASTSDGKTITRHGTLQLIR